MQIKFGSMFVLDWCVESSGHCCVDFLCSGVQSFWRRGVGQALFFDRHFGGRIVACSFFDASFQNLFSAKRF